MPGGWAVCAAASVETMLSTSAWVPASPAKTPRIDRTVWPPPLLGPEPRLAAAAEQREDGPAGDGSAPRDMMSSSGLAPQAASAPRDWPGNRDSGRGHSSGTAAEAPRPLVQVHASSKLAERRS